MNREKNRRDGRHVIQPFGVDAGTILRISLAVDAGGGARKVAKLKKYKATEYNDKLKGAAANRLPASRDALVGSLEQKATMLFTEMESKEKDKPEKIQELIEQWLTKEVSLDSIMHMEEIMQKRFNTTEAKVVAFTPFFFRAEWESTEKVHLDAGSKLEGAQSIISLLFTEAYYNDERNGYDLACFHTLLVKIKDTKVMEQLVAERARGGAASGAAMQT